MGNLYVGFGKSYYFILFNFKFLYTCSIPISPWFLSNIIILGRLLQSKRKVFAILKNCLQGGVSNFQLTIVWG